jgi:hypothetical protein
MNVGIVKGLTKGLKNLPILVWTFHVPLWSTEPCFHPIWESQKIPKLRGYESPKNVGS